VFIKVVITTVFYDNGKYLGGHDGWKGQVGAVSSMKCNAVMQ